MRSSTEFLQQLNILLAKTESSTLPRYKQLYEALRQQILDGLLLPGMQLPSSRIIAKKLGIARNTALAAIEQLCAEGYTSPRSKSGIYILETSPVNWDTKHSIRTQIKPKLSARGKKIATESQPMHLLRGAFAPGIPDLKQFPFELWQRYVTRHARNPKLDWLANPAQGGHPELRQTLADYLRTARGIRCNATQILITQGTQHSLQLIADLLADPGESVWMEDPGYSGARSAFNAAGLNIIFQPVDEDGLAPLLKAWKQPPRLIYTTPSHQFPTGVVMSATRRRHLLAAASQHQTLVIEDDYDGEFRYEGTPLAAMHALSPNQVIYLGTFSKIFFPGIRIGYMVLPEQLVDAFRVTQVRHLREPSYITQKALADFIRDGHAGNHIRKMRREYQSRRDILQELLQKELGNKIRLAGLDTGLHLVAYLPNTCSDQEIAIKAYAQGVTVGALTRYYNNSAAAKSSALLLGFGDANLQDIKKAGKILCKIIKNYLD